MSYRPSQGAPEGLDGLFVRSFPDPGEPTRITVRGRAPRWSPDGRTLYHWTSSFDFATPDSLWASDIDAGAPIEVVRTRFVLAGHFRVTPGFWDLHPDGDRFVVERPLQEQIDAALAEAGGPEQDEPERAIEHAKVAVTMDPDYSAAWRLLGQAQVAAGRIGAAAESFERGIAVARQRGDRQVEKEMQVFLRRLQQGQSRQD